MMDDILSECQLDKLHTDGLSIEPEANGSSKELISVNSH